MLITVEFVQDAPESALAVTVSFAQPTYAHPFEVGVAVAEVEVSSLPPPPYRALFKYKGRGVF